MKMKEKEWITRLYFEMYDAMVSYANSSLNDLHRAEELTQEVFLTAVRRPEVLMNSPNPKGWLYKALRNMIRNHNRSASRQLKLVSDYMSVNGKEATVSIDQPDLKLQFGELAETEDFKLIYDAVVLGKTHQEIATEQGITVANCKKRVERAKKALRRKLTN